VFEENGEGVEAAVGLTAIRLPVPAGRVCSLLLTSYSSNSLPILDLRLFGTPCIPSGSSLHF
jgi:hypothetical protein